MFETNLILKRAAYTLAGGRVWKDQTGATAVVTAITLSVLLGFTALGVEVGSWYAERRALQTAADAAALGAGYKIYKEGKESDGIAAADLPSSPAAAATADRQCYCADGSEIDCDSGTCNSQEKLEYVELELVQNHEWLFGIPGVENPTTFSVIRSLRVD